MKKLVATIMTMVMVASMILSVNVSAATSYPSLSKTNYCEFVANKDIKVYNSRLCDTRGTIVPAKNYNALVEKGDICYIHSFGKTSIVLEYPVGNGTRIGYIKTRDLLGANITPESSFKATSKVTTYKYKNGSKTGYYESGDTVYVLNGASYNIIYSAPSKNRGYKLAYVDTATKKNSTEETLTNALYKINISGSKITCGFDGYVNTSGRHEGIDFAYGIGKNVYSLTDGTVTNVVKGYNGSGGLSTIAIYDSENDKTVIYLHAAPSNLQIGQKIEQGDKIATEAWRGCSSDKGAHTHVEVRNGRKTHAAKSVGDYTLDNKNPKTYWNSLGYSVK
ncbi:MAG: M23 family metallopeptidase [Clostridia bacterium]|nr:M23 family metallopeptidase [Clostridia bacterium]